MYLDTAKMWEEALHQAGFEVFVPCKEEEIARLEDWFMRQGYQCYFFRFSDGEDPSVYSYLEDLENPEQSSISPNVLSSVKHW